MSPDPHEGLPPLAAGTVAILSTGGVRPHAIPVSTCVIAAPDRVLFALAGRRESLRRLRGEPHAALTFVESDLALTAHGAARVVEEPLGGSDGLAALAFDVESIQDHAQPTFAIEAGVRWRWTSEEAEARDDRVRGALAELAGRLSP